jgi:hypothetical protein
VLTKQSSSGDTPGGKRVVGQMGSKQKLWMCSGFRLNIDGIDDMKFTNKIDSFTIKQGIKQFYTGNGRFPEIEPTKIEFPHLTGTIALDYAGGLFDWFHTYVVKGTKDPKAQKSGSLEFLSPDRADTLFRINLFEVGIHHLQVVPSVANSDQIKRAKFELYVGRMDLDGSGSLGME